MSYDVKLEPKTERHMKVLWQTCRTFEKHFFHTSAENTWTSWNLRHIPCVWHIACPTDSPGQNGKWLAAFQNYLFKCPLKYFRQNNRCLQKFQNLPLKLCKSVQCQISKIPFGHQNSIWPQRFLLTLAQMTDSFWIKFHTLHSSQILMCISIFLPDNNNNKSSFHTEQLGLWSSRPITGLSERLSTQQLRDCESRHTHCEPWGFHLDIWATVVSICIWSSPRLRYFDWGWYLWADRSLFGP